MIILIELPGFLLAQCAIPVGSPLCGLHPAALRIKADDGEGFVPRALLGGSGEVSAHQLLDGALRAGALLQQHSAVLAPLGFSGRFAQRLAQNARAALSVEREREHRRTVHSVDNQQRRAAFEEAGVFLSSLIPLAQKGEALPLLELLLDAPKGGTLAQRANVLRRVHSVLTAQPALVGLLLQAGLLRSELTQHLPALIRRLDDHHEEQVIRDMVNDRERLVLVTGKALVRGDLMLLSTTARGALPPPLRGRFALSALLPARRAPLRPKGEVAAPRPMGQLQRDAHGALHLKGVGGPDLIGNVKDDGTVHWTPVLPPPKDAQPPRHNRPRRAAPR